MRLSLGLGHHCAIYEETKTVSTYLQGYIWGLHHLKLLSSLTQLIWFNSVT